MKAGMKRDEIEWNGTEWNGTERDGTGRDSRGRNGTEQIGTKRNEREQSCTKRGREGERKRVGKVCMYITLLAME